MADTTRRKRLRTARERLRERRAARSGRIEIADGDAWLREHDQISQAVDRSLLVFVTYCFFCLLTLGAPDANLIGEGAQIEIPIVDTKVAYSGFLVFGPLILMAVTLYLHVLLGHLHRLAPHPTKRPLPLLFNIPERGARMVTGLIAYWVPPILLAVFAWKALPRPEAPFLIALTSGMASFLLALRLGRFAVGGSRPSGSSLLYRAVLSLLFLGAVVLCLWQVTRLLRSTTALERSVLGSRPLNLYNADLHGKDLSGRSLRGADLRKANLTEADLSGADLTGADLTGAILKKTDLTQTVLVGVALEGPRDLDTQWRSVIQLVNRKLDAPLDLSWAKLSGAGLQGVDLRNVVLVGADLQGADLTGAKLIGADLRLADLRGVKSDRIQGSILQAGTVQKEGRDGDWIRLSHIEATSREKSCLSATPAEKGAHPKLLPCDANAGNQQWWIQRTSDGAARLKVQQTVGTNQDLCLDSTGIREDRIKPHLWPCSGLNPNQLWKISPVRRPESERSWSTVRNPRTDRCLDDNPGSADFEPHLWTCDAVAPAQLWMIQLPPQSP